MNVDRFKQAIAIIEEIPDEQLRLKHWQASYDKGSGYIGSNAQATCGTIACAAGWLALHPDMQAQGLSSGYCGMPRYSETGPMYSGFTALQLFFDIRDIDADLLFQSRNWYESDGDMGQLTDKQIWLKRAKIFLAGYEGTS